MRLFPRSLLIATLFIFTGCATLGLNSVQKLQGLNPGMTSGEVQEILGEPKSTQVNGDKLVLKYTLHENWKGWVPYFVVFDNDTRRLESWYEDEEGYRQSQARLGQIAQLVDEASQSGGGSGAPAGPNDPELQAWITGNYYYYSSSQVVSASSERSVTLCSDGRFRITGAFGAAGSDWGSQSEGGSGGRWTISGNRQSGTISLGYSGGNTRPMNYRVGSDSGGTMYFGELMFAYAGAADCG